MSYTFEMKKAAFAACRDNKMSDEQLLICLQSVNELVDTMHAMGEGGTFMCGYYLLQSSLNHIVDARKMK